ncbi:hypothetical protein [Caproicibacter sp. BJN0012]|uniref:hypothetical protein n=1 Tax=Caproicibacter sp. BJN0012 TaxID=3110227 RepID=UPI002E1262F0
MPKPREIYTVVTTSADADQGCFQEPTPAGSYFSFQGAQAELARLIEEEKETLDTARYDTEEWNDTVWYAYQEGYAAACFVRIEVITSLLMDEEGTDG